MNKTTRLHEVEVALYLHGSVDIAELSQTLQVSEMTIRRDINTLVSAGKAIRTRGGAMLPVAHYMDGIDLETRSALYIPQKRAIAKKAVELIQSGDTIFLDDSSTTSCIVEFLPRNIQLIVTTCSLQTAMQLTRFPNIEVICLGGNVNKATQAASGPLCNDLLRSMYFKTVFLGFAFISEDGVITTNSLDEYAIKRCLIQHSKQQVLMADSSKFMRRSYIALSNVQNFSHIITDSDIPSSFVDFCNRNGVSLTIAPCKNTV